MRFYLRLFLVSLMAVSFSQASAYTLAKKQILKIGNGAEPRELDPSISTGVPESHIIDNLFEGLMGLNPETLAPVPGVAEKYELSKDKRVYTFTLRKNAQWSDGKPITAEDFVWSWRRTLNPATASEYAYQLYYLKNGREFNTGKDINGKTKKVKESDIGVRAKSKHVLEVTLVEPTPFFLRLTAFHTLYPVPRHIVEKHKGQAWTKPGVMASNGPYVLSEWKLNKHIKLTPNPKYWNKKIAKVQEAFFYPIENQDTEDRDFNAGKLHLTNEVPVLKIPKYMAQKKKNGSKYHPYRADPYLGIYYYRFNVTKKPMNDPRVRRAITLAVDRTLIAERVTKGGEQPAPSFTPPTGTYTAKPALPLRADKAALTEARKLLADAGYPNGKGWPKGVDILFNTSEKHRKVAIAIQQMLKKNLNINIGLYNQEWKVYLNNQKKLNYAISRAGWIGDYVDPNTFLDMWVTDGGNNQTGWSNKQYDKLIADAGKETDQAKRLAIFQQAEDILMKELPVLPIYIYTNPKLVSEKLKMQDDSGKLMEFVSNVQDRIFLKNMVIVN